MQLQVDRVQETGNLQSFGSVAVLVAPAVVPLHLAVAHYAAAAAAVAFAAFAAVAPEADAADDTAASAAVAVVVAVVFDAVGFGVAVVAADVAAAASEGDAVAVAATAAAAAAAGDDDAFFAAAAASGEAVVVVEFSVALRRPGSAWPCSLETLSNSRMRTAACWVETSSGRAAAWTPAERGAARGADPGAPHLCGHVDTLASAPVASRPRRAAPTRGPSPEPGPGWHLCKPRRVRALDSLHPLAELHLRGLLCGTSGP